MYKKNKKAFTIVELIVVITILSILGTIAFVSLQSYSSNARDSVRLVDVSLLSDSLNLFYVKSDFYPEPSTGTTITYSGASVWTQGFFGNSVFLNVGSLDQNPTDPLTNKEYVYSLLNNKSEFQLSSIYEGEEYQSFNTFSNSYAANNTIISIVKGNFNGYAGVANFGSYSNVLSLPSIVTSSTGSSLSYIYLNNLFVYDGYKNIAGNYIGLGYDLNGSSGVSFVNNSNYLVFSGSILDLKSKNGTKRFELVYSLQKSFSGTVIEYNDNISDLTEININNSLEVDTFGVNFVKDVFGGKTIETTKRPWKSVDLNCDKGDITIGNQVWAGCNSTLGLGIEYSVDEGCYDYTGSLSAMCNRISSEKENIYNPTYGVDNIWGKLYTRENSGSACPIGWKLPTENDFEQLEATLNGSNCRANTDSWRCFGLGWQNNTLRTPNNNIIQAFLLPLSGIYTNLFNTFSERGEDAYLWSNTNDSFDNTLAYIRIFGQYSASVSRIGFDKTNSVSVRCIQN